MYVHAAFVCYNFFIMICNEHKQKTVVFMLLSVDKVEESETASRLTAVDQRRYE